MLRTDGNWANLVRLALKTDSLESLLAMVDGLDARGENGLIGKDMKIFHVDQEKIDMDVLHRTFEGQNMPQIFDRRDVPIEGCSGGINIERVAEEKYAWTPRT